MATVQEFIDDTLVLIGEADPGETPSSSDRNSAFGRLNRLIGRWSAAGLFIPTVVRELLSLTGAPSYTIGSGATFNTVRPLKIRAAAVLASNVSHALEIVTSEQWVKIEDKTRAGKFAEVLFYDAGYPTGTIYLTPTPASGGSLELHSLKPLAQFAAISDSIDLPPGYEDALQFALAKVLCVSYGKPMPPELAGEADRAEASITGLNAANLGQPLPAEVPQQ